MDNKIFHTGTTAAIVALNKENNNSHQFVVKGDPKSETEYNRNVEWVGLETAPYTWSQVNTKITELENKYISDQYKRNRASEYPSMADQLDDIFHNGIDGWRTSIQAIKDKYPKGDS